MTALIKARPEMDEIRWKDPARGAPLKVRITSSNTQAIVVEKTLAAGLTVRTIPISELAGIEFAFTPREVSLHQSPLVAAIPALKILWQIRQATMRISGSNVSETGLMLAKSLRLSGEISAFDEASKILEQIRGSELSGSRKDRAREEQTTIDFVKILKSGKPAEIDAAAWRITEDADNADAMLLATSFLAGRHFSELKSIEEHNPRWADDDEVRPVRDRLYHLSLDFALYPSLFYGTRVAEATAGLKQAAEIYRFTHDKVLEKGVLEDLASLYTDSELAKETAAVLARLKQAQAAGELAKIAAETKPDEPENSVKESLPTGPPPPPKRYNIFGD